MIKFIREFLRGQKYNFTPSMESTKRGILLALIDLVLISSSSILALLVRFDMHFSLVDPAFWDSVTGYLAMNLIMTELVFWLCKMYTSLWSYASTAEMFNISSACLISTILQTIGMGLTGRHVPRSYPFLYFMVLLVLITVSRYSYRFGRAYRKFRKSLKSDTVNTMVIGAGASGDAILREIAGSEYAHQRVVCIIDDSPRKQATYVHGIPIVGGRDEILDAVEYYQVEEIIFAIPTATARERSEILNICQDTGCKVRVLPGLYQIANGDVSLSMLKDVQIEDLLGREPIQTDLSSVRDFIQNNVVLVTGGGGSIGSEICRQVAAMAPRQLIVFDIYENNAYELQMDLQHRFPDLDLVVLIGSVRDKKRVHSVFETYHPDLVFHAAAHKHVPLMENSPNEAVKNNIMGTFHVAREADAHHAKKMILISTDKAVRPTNIMGASKRVCEMIIQEFAQKSETEFAAVRFGNVLGSNGSVIPLFRRQIAEGGPVTVTHPDIVRFFMTIPEAVSLVLQAGTFAQGGEIFILDMGEQVRIMDLARKMIRLSGHTEGVDMKIEITGLRPGEKLYEELLIDEKHLIETSNEKIFVVQQDPVDISNLKNKMRMLDLAARNETDDIRRLVRELVPEYRDAEEVNRLARAQREGLNENRGETAAKEQSENRGQHLVEDQVGTQLV